MASNSSAKLPLQCIGLTPSLKASSLDGLKVTSSCIMETNSLIFFCSYFQEGQLVGVENVETT